MSDTPKVVPLTQVDEMQAAIDAIRREMPKLLEHAVLIAQFKRTYFQALINEGFTEAQAMELCKAPAVMA